MVHSAGPIPPNPNTKPNAKELEQSNRQKMIAEIAIPALKNRQGAKSRPFDYTRYGDARDLTAPAGEQQINNKTKGLIIDVGNTIPYRAKIPFPAGRYHSTSYDKYDILLKDDGSISLVAAPPWMAARQKSFAESLASFPKGLWETVKGVVGIPSAIARTARGEDLSFKDEVRRLIDFQLSRGVKDISFDFDKHSQINESKIKALVEVCAEYAPYIRPSFTSKGVDGNGNPIPNKIHEVLNAKDPYSVGDRKNPYNPFVPSFDATVAASINARLADIQNAFDKHQEGVFKPAEDAAERSHQHKQYANELNDNDGAKKRDAAERGKLKKAIEGATGTDRTTKVNKEIEDLEKRAKRVNEMKDDLDKHEKTLLEKIAKAQTKEQSDAIANGLGTEAANLISLKDTLLKEREDISHRLSILKDEIKNTRVQDAEVKVVQDKLTNLDTQHKDLAHESQQLSEKITKLTAQRDALDKTHPSYDTENKKLTEKIEELSKEKAGFDEGIKQNREDVTKLEKQIKELPESHKKEREEINKKIDVLSANLVTVDKLVAAYRVDQKSDILQALEKRKQELDQQSLQPIPKL